MLIGLFRVQQWYKNLLVFLPLIFVQMLFTPSFFRVLLGFFALCAFSSSMYIINDIFDRERDKHHPKKQHRWIASGKIRVWEASIFSFILFLIGCILSSLLTHYFLFFGIGIFLLTFFYSIWGKHIIFLDIVLIAINFVLRTVAGAFIVFPEKIVRISPWLILVPFFLALFLDTAKRHHSHVSVPNATKYNPTLAQYAPITPFLLWMMAMLFLTFFALFTLFSDFPLLVITLPLVVYGTLHYLHKVLKGEPLGGDVLHVLKEPQLMIAIIVVIIMAGIIIY